ncbi:MAG: hypothetical protein ABGX16_16645 [Pirellulales bacterium]
MPLRTHPSRMFLLAALGVCMLGGGGCASCRLPKIDPTGERVLIWPKDQPQANAIVAAGDYGSLPPGNVPVPPALTDPVFPVSAPPPTVATTESAAAVPAAGSASVASQDHLTLTPERMLAPVGSEVLLRGGICTAKGYFLKDQRVDWSLSGQDVGHFVALSGRGWMKPALMPWNKPKIHSTHYATGYTTAVKAMLTRGTTDPVDDVQIRQGEAWVSITSAVEGTSHVTAFTPSLDSWQHRKASATIYWVDVQWVFPPAEVIGGSGPQVLTTTVTRQTDGQPLEGWLVRYEVADGSGARVGRQSGQVVEMATGADGSATVEVSPTHSANTSQIKMQLVRPDGWNGSDAPRLVIGSGATIIRWNGDASYLSSPNDTSPASIVPPAGIAPPISPSPTTPIQPGTSTFPITPPAAPSRAPAASVGKPLLELEIRGDPTAFVGKQANFQVSIRNTGNAPATGIVMNARFDPGLSHLGDRDRTLEIENTGVGDLAPNQSRTLDLIFDVLQVGQLCHDVTVTSQEGAQQERRVCVTASEPPPVKQPGLKVVKNGDRLKNVGETTLFTIVLTNTGQLPLTNVQVIDQYDAALRPRPPGPSYQLQQGRVYWQLARLEVGESKQFEIECDCLQAAKQACSLVKVTAESEGASSLVAVDDHCVEIAAGSPGSSPGAASGNVQESLQMEILSFANPARAGTQATYQIVVTNKANVSDEQVTLKVLFPSELTPDTTTVQAAVPVTVRAGAEGSELNFEPMKTMRPGETLAFMITATVVRAGQVRIVANLVSRNMPQGIQKTETVEIIGR